MIIEIFKHKQETLNSISKKINTPERLVTSSSCDSKENIINKINSFYISIFKKINGIKDKAILIKSKTSEIVGDITEELIKLKNKVEESKVSIDSKFGFSDSFLISFNTDIENILNGKIENGIIIPSWDSEQVSVNKIQNSNNFTVSILGNDFNESKKTIITKDSEGSFSRILESEIITTENFNIKFESENFGDKNIQIELIANTPERLRLIDIELKYMSTISIFEEDLSGFSKRTFHERSRNVKFKFNNAINKKIIILFEEIRPTPGVNSKKTTQLFVKKIALYSAISPASMEILSTIKSVNKNAKYVGIQACDNGLAQYKVSINGNPWADIKPTHRISATNTKNSILEISGTKTSVYSLVSTNDETTLIEKEFVENNKINVFKKTGEWKFNELSRKYSATLLFEKEVTIDAENKIIIIDSVPTSGKIKFIPGIYFVEIHEIDYIRIVNLRYVKSIVREDLKMTIEMNNGAVSVFENGPYQTLMSNILFLLEEQSKLIGEKLSSKIDYKLHYDSGGKYKIAGLLDGNYFLSFDKGSYWLETIQLKVILNNTFESVNIEQTIGNIIVKHG
jgi:hypothetical protein